MVKELLQQLSNAHGTSGNEESIYALIKKEITPYVDEILEDTMGNLIAVKHGDDFKVMLAAHMDEIGLMVSYVDEKGFIRFVPIGGWYAPTLYNQRVLIHGRNGTIAGVVGGKPPHMMKDEERKRGVKIEEMFVDVGAASAEEVAALGIEIGDPVTVDRSFAELSNNRVSGKAFDNRAGVVMLIKAMQKMKSPSTVYAVFTVQEEVGCKGAKTSAFGIDPDCAIATDVTIPGDHPGIEQKDAPVKMGKGPVVAIVEAGGRGVVAHKRMISWLRDVAEKAQIPVQFEVGSGGVTDASSIYLTRAGIPCTSFSIPTRYIHSPVEVLDIADLEAAVDLLVEALKTRPDFSTH
jgi:endoglucanase